MAGYKDFVMVGGRPWGIRMLGGRDTGLPLKIASVTPGSKAELQGVLADMELLSINDNDTSDVSLNEAQFIIKGASDKLTLRMKTSDGSKSSRAEAKPAVNISSADDDQDFLEDLKKSMMADEEEKSEVKGGTFKMLQQHIDAGQATSVLSAFDKPKDYQQRNASIRTTAPEVQETGACSNPKAREVIMEGGRPWGIRIQGGKGTKSPLHIANVQAGSKGYHKSLLLNDKIVSINGQDTSVLTMLEAQDIIKATGDVLTLEIISVNQPGLREEKANDEKFFKELTDSVKGGTEDWSGRKVKGSAFKMLQNVVDSGHVR